MRVHRLALVLPAAALPLLLAFQPRGEAVSFAPEDGSKLSKTLEIEGKFYLEDVSMVADGQEMPAEMILSEVDEGISMNMAVSVTDEFVKTVGGRYQELLRTYDSISMEAGMESEMETMDEFAEYEDSTVRFKWNEEDGEYVITFAEDDTTSDTLEGLDPDMDFLALLPDGEVEEGDTWEATGVDLGTVFLPGGLVPLDMGDDEDAEMGQMVQERIESQLEAAFSEFAVRCEYGGVREEDGVKIAVVTFKFESEVSIDLTDIVNEIVDQLSSNEGVDVEADIAATLDLQMEGEGTLLWALEAHRVHGFEMKADMTLLGDVEADVEAMGEAHSLEASAEISGEMAWSLSTD